MDKAILKWVLTQKEDEILYELAIATECKVKGFREITRSNIKQVQVRSQVINELLKTTKAMKLKPLLHEHINKVLTEELVKELCEKKQSELMELIETMKFSLVDILLSLITGEEDYATLAEKLFNDIRDQGKLSLYESKENSINKQEEEPILTQLDKQISQEKEKIVQLETSLMKVKEKRRIEVQEWKKKRKIYKDEIKKLKLELENQHKQVIVQEAVTARLENKVVKLQEEIDRLTKQVTTTSPLSVKVHQPVNLTTDKMKVVLLGEGVGEIVSHTAKYDVELVANSQIEDFLKRDSQVEELWMLSFQISPQKQRKIRNTFKENTVKEFANLVALQEHINKK